MPRRYSNLRPINRVKHVLDSQGGLVIGTQTTVVLANAVDNPTLGTTNEVHLGSTINSLFISCEVNATSSAALSNVYFQIVKNPGNNLSFANGNVVGTSDNKKYVFHQEMVMLQQVTNSNPRTLFKGVISVPKGYRRMGPNDRINVLLFSPGVTVNFCVQTHYKEFR